MIGVTGHGKSNFCSYLYKFATGQESPLFKSSALLESTAMESLTIADKIGEGNGKIIDTPGWSDSRGISYSLKNLKLLWQNLKEVKNLKSFSVFCLTIKSNEKRLDDR